MNSKILTWGLVLLALMAVMLSSGAVVNAEEAAAPDVIEVDDTEDIEITEEDDDADPEDVDDDEPEDYEEEEFAEFVLEASPDVKTNFIFPDYEGSTLEIGEKTTLLAVLSNEGDSSFNLTEAGAFLHSNYDLTYYIQNYSVQEPDTILEPGEQVTIEYIFTPHERLEPEVFHLSAYVQYNDTSDDMMYRSTFLNQTITLVDKPQPFDIVGALSYLAVIAALGAAIYVFGLGKGKNSSSSSSGSKQERGTKGDDSDDWGEVYSPKAAASRSRSSRKKKTVQ